MTACTSWDAAGEFAATRHGALTRRQAAALGISDDVVRRLLRDGHVREPVTGVLVVAGAPDTWRQRLIVATMASNGSGAAGFRASAALQGLDGYAPGPLELLVPSQRHIRIAGVALHRGPMDPQDLDHVDGIACTTIARTLADLGSVDPIGRVQTAFESAWRAGTPLDLLRDTAVRLHRPGQRGTGVLLRLVALAEQHAAPTESALEVRVEQILRGIPGLCRQHEVRDRQGRFIARVDFAVPELRLAIEAHSRQFHFGIGREHADAAREAALQAEG